MSQNITNYIGKIPKTIEKIESSISALLDKIENIGEIEDSLVYKEIDVLNNAKAINSVSKWLEGKKIIKEIYKEGKIISFITN